MAVKDWSTTPSNNANADPQISIPEGMAASAVNDEIRDLMAVIKGDFANSLTASGYQKFPNGLIIQWVVGTGGTGGLNVTWPIVFPTACLLALTTVNSGANTAVWATYVSSKSTSGVSLLRVADTGGSAALVNASNDVAVFSLGY